MSRKSPLAIAAIAMLGTTFLIPTSASAWPHGFAVRDNGFARPAFQASGNQAGMLATRTAHFPHYIPTVTDTSPTGGFARANGRPDLLIRGSGKTTSNGGVKITPIGPGGANTGGGVAGNGVGTTLANGTNSTNLANAAGRLAGATNLSKVAGIRADGVPVPPPQPPGPVTPTPPAGTGQPNPTPPSTTGTGTNVPTPPAPCTKNCALPGVVGVSVGVGGGIVVVEGNSQVYPSPRPHDRQNFGVATTQNGIASNFAHTGYQAIALAWNNDGSWVTRKAGSLENASEIALSTCNSQYGTCALSSIAVKPTSYACMALGRSETDQKNLVAVTRGTLDEARAAVLEALGAPGNAKLIVYSDCSA